MKPFTPNKCIKRQIKIKSSDRAIADAEWILTISGSGVRMKRYGASCEGEMFLSWRSVVSHALVHRAGWKPSPVKGAK